MQEKTLRKWTRALDWHGISRVAGVKTEGDLEDRI
jgi:hypothetical protein